MIDDLSYNSRLRYVSADVKGAYALFTMLFCIVSRSLLMGIFIIALNHYISVRRGGITPRRYIVLMSIPLAFLLTGMVAIVINFSSEPLDAFAVPIGDIWITGSFAGILKALRLTVTALAAVSCLLFFSMHTTMPDMILSWQKWHLPALLIELMMLIYRFIFLLLAVAAGIRTAQEARLGNRNFKTSVLSFGALAQALFLLAMKRAGALYDAMEARCYNGRIALLQENRPAARADMVRVFLLELSLLLYTMLKFLPGDGYFKEAWWY